MAHTVIGLFDNKTHANEAIESLRDEGYTPDAISIITRDTTVKEELESSSKADNVASGAVGGAGTGGVIGGLVGLIVGLTPLTIPGLGAILIGGPLAAALGITGAAATAVTGALTGALAGGLVGALVGLGVPEEKAKHFEERIREGDILISVDVESADSEKVSDIFSSHGAEEVNTYTFS